jgi:hypothetical protein
MREMNDFSAVLREGAWIAGCIGLAAAYLSMTPDGLDPVVFLSIFLYGLTGLLRFGFRWLRRLPGIYS